MCTITFLPTDGGCLLAMNRDERITRAREVPPSVIEENGYTYIAPREPSGGTWIATNAHGSSFALINWYAVTPPPIEDPISRGTIIPAIAGLNDTNQVARKLRLLRLHYIRPFRLIAVLLSQTAVTEWTWNGTQLQMYPSSWDAKSWYSSGYDEPSAQEQRERTRRSSLKDVKNGSLAWIRRLHSSHDPIPGPYSICMHREDARTMSYTEVAVSAQAITMRYASGLPCQSRLDELSDVQMPRFQKR
jgi:hypothetical protein